MGPDSFPSAGQYQLQERYQLEGRIAAGAVGEVWRARDTVLGRPVAVKLLRDEYLQDAQTRIRFRAEARHAGALSHPGIAQIYDYGENGDEPPYLVMELVDGPSLAAVLAGGPLDPARAMDVIAQTAAGLQAAHQAGLIHRDIKPANLLIGPGDQVKITDFGIAHAAGSAPLTRTGLLVGTPAYLAPERATGASATTASDLYSLGIVAYECLAGEPPFTGTPLEVAAAHRFQPLPSLPGTVPAQAASLVDALTRKDPSARPNAAGRVAEQAAQLRRALDSQPVPGRPSRSDAASADEHRPADVPALLAAPQLAGDSELLDGPRLLADPDPGPAGGWLSEPPPGGDSQSADARQSLGPDQTASEDRPAEGAHGAPGAPASPPAADTLSYALPDIDDLYLHGPGGAETLPPGYLPPASRPPGHRSPYGARRGPGVLVAAAAGALVLAAGLTAWLLSGGHGKAAVTHHPAAGPSHVASGSRFVKVSQALDGHRVEVVARRLRALGLRVRISWQSAEDQQPSIVVSVEPTGRVPTGSVVHVIATRAPGHDHHDHGNGNGHGHDGNGQGNGTN